MSPPGYCFPPQTLNTTWPHPKHIFLNNGKGGASLHSIIEGSCMSSFTPEEVDLVVLDTTTNWAPAYAAETLIRRFLASASEPAVVLLSNTRNCQYLAPPQPMPDVEKACALGCLPKYSPDACAALGPEPYTGQGHVILGRSTAPYDALAEHYNVSHIDLSRLMRSAFMDGRVSTELNVSKWQLLSRFYSDMVHLNRKDLGPLLVADVLLNWLYKQQGLYLQQQQQQQQQQQHSGLGYVIPEAVHAQARKQYASRCFGVSFEQVAQRVQRAHGPDADKAKQLLLTDASGDFFGGAFYKDEPNKMQALPPLHVLRRERFEIRGYYKGASGGIKFKPGYVASSPGALLEFQVSTVFAAAPAPTGVVPTPAAPTSRPEVVVTYTSSYDGWGTARISCLSGCICESKVVDAADHEKKHSLHRTVVLRVSQHAQCRVVVEVLKETSSVGHKFKVSSVMTRILV